MSYFEPTADPGVFLGTRRTEGPWEPGLQHGGPPSALLARAIEALPSSIPGGSQLTRLTMEILGPVPVGEVRVAATVARPGRAVELVEAELSANGRAALRCRAWRIRTAEVALPPAALAGPPPAPPIPDTEAPHSDRPGWFGTVEFRFVSGAFGEPGPARVWTRVRVPVVAGEEPSPLQRLMAVADAGNGLSSLFPFEGWWFINTELTVHLHRIPVGDWTYLDARSTVDASGVGLAETELYDEKGRVGRGAQSLMIGRRPLS